MVKKFLILMVVFWGVMAVTAQTTPVMAQEDFDFEILGVVEDDGSVTPMEETIPDNYEGYTYQDENGQSYDVRNVETFGSSGTSLIELDNGATIATRDDGSSTILFNESEISNQAYSDFIGSINQSGQLDVPTTQDLSDSYNSFEDLTSDQAAAFDARAASMQDSEAAVTGVLETALMRQNDDGNWEMPRDGSVEMVKGYMDKAFDDAYMAENPDYASTPEGIQDYLAAKEAYYNRTIEMGENDMESLGDNMRFLEDKLTEALEADLADGTLDGNLADIIAQDQEVRNRQFSDSTGTIAMIANGYSGSGGAGSIAGLFALTGVDSSSPIFASVADKLQQAYNSTYRIVVLLCAMAYLAFAIKAFFGSFQWGQFFTITGAFLLVAVTSQLITFLASDVGPSL